MRLPPATLTMAIAAAFWFGSIAAAAGLEDVRRGPQPIRPFAAGVGRMIDDAVVQNLAGEDVRLDELVKQNPSGPTVIALTSTGCPLCLKYAPTLVSIGQRYADRGVNLLFLNPNQSEPEAAIEKSVAARGNHENYLRDVDKTLCRALGATTTTEVFVLDASRTLRYRGAVDDQYGFAYSLPQPRRNYLTDALDELLQSMPVSLAATDAPGCRLFYETDADADGSPNLDVTYHHQISRLIQNHCLECHRTGGIGPMSLQTYDQVRDYGAMIAEVIDRGVMPPWYAADSQDESTSHAQPLRWLGERRVSDDEKRDLATWLADDMPPGDPADSPPAVEFPDGWSIGQPDAVFAFDEPVSIPATGTLPYQNVTIQTDNPTDRWVRGIEIRPGDRRAVHHVIVSIDDRAAGRRDRGDESNYFWAAYVPGNSRVVYPEGFAKRLPAGATLRFQMHYTPYGTATTDVTRLGLVYADSPPQHEVKVAGIADRRFAIPPGEANHEIVTDRPIPSNLNVLSFMPHAHLRGKSVRFDLVSGDTTRNLLDVPRYDFNWQLAYRLTEPLPIRRGDILRYSAVYDNSADNPANPDPTKTVRWGEQTHQEMHLGIVEYYVDP